MTSGEKLPYPSDRYIPTGLPFVYIITTGPRSHDFTEYKTLGLGHRGSDDQPYWPQPGDPIIDWPPSFSHDKYDDFDPDKYKNLPVESRISEIEGSSVLPKNFDSETLLSLKPTMMSHQNRPHTPLDGDVRGRDGASPKQLTGALRMRELQDFLEGRGVVLPPTTEDLLQAAQMKEAEKAAERARRRGGPALDGVVEGDYPFGHGPDSE